MLDLDSAIAELRSGRPIVMPTDTVYGIAVRPDAPGGIEAVFRIKGRPEDRPLPVLAAALDELHEIAVLDERARRIGREFWPGAVTLVLPRAPGFSVWLGGAGEASVAVRVPACEVALELLRRSGPLAVTSANRSGDPPATTAAEARQMLSGVDLFLDAGPRNGAPSTILSLLDGPVILREGAVPATELLKAGG